MSQTWDEIGFRTGAHRLQGYRSGAGNPHKLLLAHGGPGVPCSYLFHAHRHYADHGFDVVSWDQLGCGKSDRPEDKSLWSVARYVQELDDVRAHLGWERFLLLGNSWGGILTMEYALAHGHRLRAAVIGNIAASIPPVARGFERCKAALGEATVRMMAQREAEGSTEHPEYAAARTLLLYRHMCRLDVWPQALLDSLGPEAIGRGPWDTMFGPHFFNCSGNLRNWDRLDDMPKLSMPCLLTASEWDYVLPEFVRMTAEHIPGAKLAFFRNSAHLPFWDAPEAYHAAVLPFLQAHAEA